MKPNPPKHKSIGITLRTALLSWLVTLATLTLFIAVIIPQQKQTFLENLDSKAHGLAVSLRDVAAGAAVNEDFSSVVDHCKEMLNGDKMLDYLVITKNDGFSLINDRSGWRSETDASQEWRPEKRVSNSGIGLVPLFQRRVFHYSQPFDYSGIQWGWIHVGLSLESYDRSVAQVYSRTGLLAIICIALSLGASVLYANRLVRPILRLRQMVHKVAGGDLTVRAVIDRTDELGSLASSVNQMTEALLRRDRILESVRFAAQQFLSTADWGKVIHSVLAKVGTAAEVGCARVCENQKDPANRLVAIQKYEWLAEDTRPEVNRQTEQYLDYQALGLERWMEVLSSHAILAGPVQELPAGERAWLGNLGIRSLIIIPIRVEGVWWGFLEFDDCRQARAWTESERDSLRAAADILGSAIARQRTQLALIEAKELLEQRVRERTQELEEQVKAKERAHQELAEAQHQLLETSRQAGMAEVATGVLHNVGNVLNSVNGSVNVINDQLSQSQIPTLGRVAGLLDAHRQDLAAFVTQDPKGKLVPEFISQLARLLEEERARLSTETQALVKNVEHIKEIVAMQQSYAKVAGITEDLPAVNLVEDALRLNEGGFHRHGIVVQRQFEPVPPVRIDKHKVLQILVNLMRNAKQSLNASDRADKLLTVAVARNGDNLVKVTVRDNGIGIAREHLTRVFGHGFTTKKDGHGFGLHSGALAAKEMGGRLWASSDGPGTGATFTLELPIATKTANP